MTREGRSWLAAGLLVAVTLVWWRAGSNDRAEPGAQVPSPSVSLELAERIGWQQLVPGDGELRDAFPEPMLWDGGSRLCVGFSRPDFGPDDRRPSLARCVPSQVATSLEVNEIAVINTVQSGADIWHFILAEDDVIGAGARLGDGDGLDGRRVYTAGPMFVVLLPADDTVVDVTWRTKEGRFRCEPAADAARSAEFCPV